MPPLGVCSAAHDTWPRKRRSVPVRALLLSRGGAVISAISISDGSVVRARVSEKASAVLNGRPD